MTELRDPLVLAGRCLRLAACVPDPTLADEMRAIAHELHRLAVELEAMTFQLDAVALRHRIVESQANLTAQVSHLH